MSNETHIQFSRRTQAARYFLQALLFNSCIAEATLLVKYLEKRVVDNQEDCPNSPWLALSAMLCFRRRIRTIVLPRSFMKLLWDCHPAYDAHRSLGQLSIFMKDMDDSLERAEDSILISRVQLLQTTVVASLKSAYSRKERMGISQQCVSASPALLHWRVVLRAMVRRCGLNTDFNFRTLRKQHAYTRLDVQTNAGCYALFP